MSTKRDFPSVQPFNVNPRKNLTKNLRGLVSWWAKAPFHNNRVQKAEKQ
jgi:hypothetical protein